MDYLSPVSVSFALFILSLFMLQGVDLWIVVLGSGFIVIDF